MLDGIEKVGTSQIGLIGIGLLGLAVAERLLACGVKVRGFDNNEQRCTALERSGGILHPDAGAVIRKCPTVILSLPNSEIVSSVVRECSADFVAGQVVVDTTTGDPRDMAAIGRALSGLGVEYLEATVAGSSTQVRSGDAALFLGGDLATAENMKPVLDVVAKKHFYLGPVGAASRFKLVHNLVLGLQRAVLAEGLAFAEQLGFQPEGVLKILRDTPAASAVMDVKGKQMISGNYPLQARLSQHKKDVRLILDEAARVGAQTPLSQLHFALLEQAEQLGWGDADNSAIIEVFRRHDGKAP